MAKQPSFQFYPGDWMKDPELRVCSHFARGLLVDLLCAMFEAKHRGRLAMADNVTPWTNEQIVGLSSGSTPHTKLEALQELEAAGVLKRDEHGVLYSARMVRDEEIRLARAESGSKGGSKTQAKCQANTQANHQAKSGSSSSSSSSSSDTNSTHTQERGDWSHLSDAVQRAIKFWNQYWVETHGNGKPDSPTKIDAMLMRAKSAGWSDEAIVESITSSVAWRAQSWRDPEADHDKATKARINGRQGRAIAFHQPGANFDPTRRADASDPTIGSME